MTEKKIPLLYLANEEIQSAEEWANSYYFEFSRSEFPHSLGR